MLEPQQLHQCLCALRRQLRRLRHRAEPREACLVRWWVEVRVGVGVRVRVRVRDRARVRVRVRVRVRG